MRHALWACAFVLAAGAAQASIPPDRAARPAADTGVIGTTGVIGNGRDTTRHAGRVWLQDRPMPGTVMPMPDFSRPLRGPHGGVVAGLPRVAPAS